MLVEWLLGLLLQLLFPSIKDGIAAWIRDWRGRTLGEYAAVVRRPRPSALQRLRALLRERYSSARLDVDNDMLEKGVQPTVDNLRVQIVMLPRADLRSEFRQHSFDSSSDIWRVEHVFTRAGKSLKNVELDSLFRDIPKEVVERQDTFRVVAISSAGCGKTTVFTKVAPQDWASGELWTGLFDILVARELRYEEVRCAKNTRELFGLDRFHLSKAQRAEVLQYIDEHREAVCLVLDGLDETSLPGCSEFVQDVIHGRELRGIRLVLTSRPCGAVFQLTDAGRLDRKVELVGFRPEDVERYIGKILNTNEASQLLKEIHGHPHLLSMMSTPVLAYEICKMFHWRKQVPSCVADIFLQMILRLAERRSEFRYKRWSDVPGYVQNPILALGSYSFKMLLDQQLVFSETELRSCSIMRDAVSLGLLVACDHTPADDTVKQWRFSHLTLQESLAAKFVSCSGTMSGGKIVELVECIGPDTGHMRTFWMLLAAELNTSCLETLVNSLMLRERSIGATADGIQCDIAKLNFPLKYHRTLCERLSRSQMNRLAELLLANVLKGSGAQFVENQLSRTHGPSDREYLQTLLLTWVKEFPAANDNMLVEAIAALDHGAATFCREIKEQTQEGGSTVHSSLIPTDTYYQAGFAQSRRDLAFQCFAENALCRGEAAEPVHSIAASLQHRGGAIAINAANPWMCRTMDKVIQHHPGAVRSVCLKGFCASSSTQVLHSLTLCDTLTEISVEDCLGQLKSVTTVIQRSASTLQRLHVFNPPVACDEMQQLAGSMQSLPCLTYLSLDCCNLPRSSGRILSRALSAMTTLEEVELLGLDFDYADEVMEILCSALCACRELEKLSGNFSPPSLVALAGHMHHWPKLACIILDSCDFSALDDDKARRFINAVNATTGLHTLELARVRLLADHPLQYQDSYRQGLRVYVY